MTCCTSESFLSMFSFNSCQGACRERTCRAPWCPAPWERAWPRHWDVYQGTFPTSPQNLAATRSGRKPPFCPWTPELPSARLEQCIEPVLPQARSTALFLTRESPGHERFGKGITFSMRLEAGDLTQSSGGVNKAGRRRHAETQSQSQWNRAHGELTGKEEPLKMRQVLIRSEFIPAETLLILSWRQNSTRHRSVVWIFFMGFLNTPSQQRGFLHPCPCFPAAWPAGQASLQSTSAQLKLFSKKS